MPVKPDSRFAGQPVLQVQAPDGTTRQVIALRLEQPVVEGVVARHLVTEGEGLDLLARRFFGDERLWWRILDANPLIYPLDLAAGDIVDLPAPGPATRVTRARSF